MPQGRSEGDKVAAAGIQCIINTVFIWYYNVIFLPQNEVKHNSMKCNEIKQINTLLNRRKIKRKQQNETS